MTRARDSVGSSRIFERAAAHTPDLYLLTGDEIPFVQDGLRDGEHIRHEMQDRFRAALAAQQIPWIEVRGDVAARVAASVPLVRDAVARRLTFAAPPEARPHDEQVALQRQCLMVHRLTDLGEGKPRRYRSAVR